MQSTRINLMLAVVLACCSTAAGGLVPDLVVASYNTDNLLRYDGQTGAFIDVFAEGLPVFEPRYMTAGSDGNLYVSSGYANQDGVFRYDGRTGQLLDTFASSGLNNPQGLAFGPNYDLYVISSATVGTGGKVQRYDGETGAFIETIVSAPIGLNLAQDLAFGPDGELYVLGDRLRRYNENTGMLEAFIEVSGGHFIFGPDGNIYIHQVGRVDRYDGQTGGFIDTFASGGGLSFPMGLVFGPDGNLYVSSGGTASVLRYDGQTGEFIDTFASGGGLDGPMELVFIPEPTPALLMVLGVLCMGRRSARRGQRH